MKIFNNKSCYKWEVTIASMEHECAHTVKSLPIYCRVHYDNSCHDHNTKILLLFSIHDFYLDNKKLFLR